MPSPLTEPPPAGLALAEIVTGAVLYFSTDRLCVLLFGTYALPVEGLQAIPYGPLPTPMLSMMVLVAPFTSLAVELP